jgi:hypothetical protein
LTSDLSDNTHSGVDDVEDTEGRDRGEQPEGVHAVGIPQNSLSNPQLVGLVGDHVGLEDHVQRNEDTSVCQEGNVSELNGSDPLKDTSVLVNDLSLFEVEGIGGVLGGHLDERLVDKGRVENVLFEFEKTVHGSTEELGVAETVSDVIVLLFGSDRNVVFVSFSVIVVSSDRAVLTLLLPLDDVLERNLFMPGSVSDESVLVGEGPHGFVVDVSALEAEVRKHLLVGTVGIEIGINSGYTSLVRTIEVGDGLPNFTLDLEIVLEIVDDGVVGNGDTGVFVLIEI